MNLCRIERGVPDGHLIENAVEIMRGGCAAADAEEIVGGIDVADGAECGLEINQLTIGIEADGAAVVDKCDVGPLILRSDVTGADPVPAGATV